MGRRGREAREDTRRLDHVDSARRAPRNVGGRAVREHRHALQPTGRHRDGQEWGGGMLAACMKWRACRAGRFRQSCAGSSRPTLSSAASDLITYRLELNTCYLAVDRDVLLIDELHISLVRSVCAVVPARKAKHGFTRRAAAVRRKRW
eukprot:3496914-Pleurochrysis_carterae.AAC.1